MLCLYKNLLNHHQNKIVHYSLTVLFQQSWIKNTNFIKLILMALNKNDVNSDVLNCFENLKQFVLKIEENTYLDLLNKSLDLKWVPGSLWLFYNSVLTRKCSLELLPVMLNAVKNLEELPDKFIRYRCLNQILLFVKSGNCATFNYYIDICKLFVNNDEAIVFVLKENNVISFDSLKWKIMEWTESTTLNEINLFMKMVKCKGEKEQLKEIYIKLFDDMKNKKFPIDISNKLLSFILDDCIEIKNYDFIKVHFEEMLLKINTEEELSDMMKVMNRLNLKTNELDFSSTKILDILHKPDDYNVFQISVAFNMISLIDDEKLNTSSIIKDWIDKHLKKDRNYCSYMFIGFIRLCIQNNFEFKCMDDFLMQNLLEYMFKLHYDDLLNFLILYIPTFIEKSYLFLIDFLFKGIFKEITNMKKSQFFIDITIHFIHVLVASLTVPKSKFISVFPIIQDLLDLSKSHKFISNYLMYNFMKNFNSFCFHSKYDLVNPIIEILFSLDAYSKSDRYLFT